MTKKSEHFERQIERIHSLLNESGAEVTWNDRIPDPNNPEQMRQIDVTVRRDEALTAIECRIHATPQDVQWIEELIGRKASLRADAIIGVSASGFTGGAILKAKAHGVILRDMKSLTEPEVSAWGKPTRVSVEVHHFDNTNLTFTFDRAANGHMSLEKIEDAFASRRLPLASLFDVLTDATRERDPVLAPTTIRAKVRPRNISIDGIRVVSIDIATNYWCEEKTMALLAVSAYGSPELAPMECSTYVELFEEGRFEIAQTSDRFSLTMDISSIKLPIGAKLGRIKLAFTRPVELAEVNLLGNSELGFWLGPSTLHLTFE